ncbi:MAG: protein translocase subunit SecD [Nitrospirae bacterium]|nr:MAG: protein translocase subunit SecD [Nitrospirota bacterium]
MKKNLKWKIGLIIGSVLLSFIFLLPNLPVYRTLPEGLKEYLPQRGIALGLDLKGGVHLVFEVQGQRAVEITTERIAKRIKDILKKMDIKAGVKVQGTKVIVSATDEGTRKLIEDSYPGLDIAQKGDHLEVSLSSAEIKRIKANAVEQALETIRNRVDQFGVAEPVIHRQGENEIVVQLPGYKDPKRAVQLIGKTAQLEFRLLDEEAPLAAELPQSIRPEEEKEFLERIKDKIPEGDIILFQRIVDPQTGEVRKRPYLLKKEVLLTGDLLSEARVAIDRRFNEPYVSLTFNSAGAKIFEEVTGANVGKRLAIILDGNVYSAPVIRERIAGGNAQITGSFSMQEAKDLAIVLRAGALPAPVKLLQNVTVGPSLGRDSIEAGKKAGIIAILLVVGFMVFYYRMAGMIADLALVLNVILLLGAMAMLHATLTMPGIAGIILAIGMAVDSNVLMFERMREEYRAGKTPRAAVEAGYDKAFLTIVDSHVTTLITAAVLFQFGTGPIKGFAVTLSLGVAINLFTALVGTKTVFDLILSKWQLRRLSI